MLTVVISVVIYFRHVEGALNEFTPDVVVYNAGTDILSGDPLGLLSISPQVSSNLYNRTINKKIIIYNRIYHYLIIYMCNN